jgi:hypothetical protein
MSTAPKKAQMSAKAKSKLGRGRAVSALATLTAQAQ